MLEVKTGNGAFTPTLETARRLAHLMVAIGNHTGRRTIAVISDMNQTLGNAVGNVLELAEAIDTLRDAGPPDLRSHCLLLAGQMLRLAGIAQDAASGQLLAEEALANGSALEKFRALVTAQGGDGLYVDEPKKLSAATITKTVKAKDDGFLARMDAINIGKAATMLGAGRERKNGPIDLDVGIVVHQKVGARINRGDKLFTIHANNSKNIKNARAEAMAGIEIKTEKVFELPLHHDVVE